MGAEWFDDWIKVEEVEDIAEAFSRMKAKAYWDYGHSGYSGSLAEKPSYEVIECPLHIQTKDQFKAWMHEIDAGRSKWDDALMTEWNGYYIAFGYASS